MSSTSAALSLLRTASGLLACAGPGSRLGQAHRLGAAALTPAAAAAAAAGWSPASLLARPLSTSTPAGRYIPVVQPPVRPADGARNGERESENGERGGNGEFNPCFFFLNLDPPPPLSPLSLSHTLTAAPGPPRPDLVARLLTEEGLLSREARAAAGRAAAAAAAARGEGDTGSSEVQSE